MIQELNEAHIIRWLKLTLKLAYRQVYCYTLYYKKYHQLKIEKANKEKNDQMHEPT